MRYKVDEQRRKGFRDWLRSQLRDRGYYYERGERYFVSEFYRDCKAAHVRVEEVSLGRYLREENAVVPTPESCRELANALNTHPVHVLMAAGYLELSDFVQLPDDILALAQPQQEQAS